MEEKLDYFNLTCHLKMQSFGVGHSKNNARPCNG